MDTRQLLASFEISIHALREEGDLTRPRWALPRTHFYPRPPRGGRLCQLGYQNAQLAFLSTPSARRATLRCQYTQLQ